MGKVTTHILDTAAGCPARDVQIDIYIQEGEDWQHLGNVRTNDDGRTDAPVIAEGALQAAVYKLEFHVGDYFRADGATARPFLDIVPIVFGIEDESQHYHVPLLASPFSYSTYRGS